MAMFVHCDLNTFSFLFVIPWLLLTIKTAKRREFMLSSIVHIRIVRAHLKLGVVPRYSLRFSSVYYSPQNTSTNTKQIAVALSN